MLTMLADHGLPVDAQTIAIIVLGIMSAIGGLIQRNKKKREEEAAVRPPPPIATQRRTPPQPTEQRPRWSRPDEDQEEIEAELEETEELSRPAPAAPVPQPRVAWPPSRPAKPTARPAPTTPAGVAMAARPAVVGQSAGIAPPKPGSLPRFTLAPRSTLAPVATAVDQMLRNRTQLQAAFVLSELLGPPVALRDEHLQ